MSKDRDGCEGMLSNEDTPEIDGPSRLIQETAESSEVLKPQLKAFGIHA